MFTFSSDMLGPKTNHEPQDYLLLALVSADSFYITRNTILHLSFITKHMTAELYKETSFLEPSKEHIAEIYRNKVLASPDRQNKAHLFSLLKDPFEPDMYSVLKYLST